MAGSHEEQYEPVMVETPLWSFFADSEVSGVRMRSHAGFSVQVSGVRIGLKRLNPAEGCPVTLNAWLWNVVSYGPWRPIEHGKGARR